MGWQFKSCECAFMSAVIIELGSCRMDWKQFVMLMSSSVGVWLVEFLGVM